MLQNRPFDFHLSPSSSSHRWTIEAVSEILRSVPRFFFHSPHSIGRQKGFRHRPPLKVLRSGTDQAKLVVLKHAILKHKSNVLCLWSSLNPIRVKSNISYQFDEIIIIGCLGLFKGGMYMLIIP